jgi:hypothetical protein
MITSTLRRRLPARAQVAPVLATIMFLVYTYAFYRLFWYVPSWLNYLPIQAIAGIVAYMAVLALFESLAVLAPLLAISAILPAAWFRERFTTLGTLAVWVLGAGALLVHEDLERLLAPFDSLELLGVLLAAAMLMAAVLGVLGYLVSRRFRILEVWVNGLAERMTIFFYLYLPFSALGLAVVLARLVF